ncbi:nicotinate-nucleotide--dimethylbenzimidazole phosphoribosyltransferase [Alkalibacter rhizosphaerae]|uniref:Nicotinate-nucleotide--dimethylbenzimidazole phosphoribosyltransferase n=1 Tax=Alkalibacter rhizosphaerae TaxID=2815577 RepID=A0A974XEJ2_9FIRM|nr:nicotinate-nucleotide--dimethylbenzimidazole phosphoribosyltransferase [Alkalibacter rhizosphaerae]QSX08368.1 nicotinate-nucleotide--dimethylbenzimidazole phosphoribosyltransferase [Alkalibacter rhizosphaerae]
MKIMEKVLKNIEKVDESQKAQMQEYVDGLLKPMGSLGVLEGIAVQVAGIDPELFNKPTKKAVLVFAGDHGICEEGITSAPQPVTALMTNFIANGKSGVGAISRQAGADVIVTDVGVNATLDNPNVRNKKVRFGTGNMVKETAMTREEAVQALEIGMETALEMIDKGYNVLATGEMGIGNTTPSSAIFSVFGNIDPQEVTGIGANLSSDLLDKKSEVIRRAIEKHQPDPQDPIDVLYKVGGLEIAAMAGAMLAGASKKVPVLIDGFISSAAAAIAVKMDPCVNDYLICSHASAEKGAQKGLELIGFKPYLYMDMRLGEGSGAALAFNVVDAAISMVNNMGTYAEAGIDVV